MIGYGDPLRTIVARDHDVEQFDHDVAVNLRQMIERQVARFESDDERLAQGLETGHVAADEGAPDTRVHAGQTSRQIVVADELSISREQPIENERLGPLLQT